jgi:hypothetical protein
MRSLCTLYLAPLASAGTSGRPECLYATARLSNARPWGQLNVPYKTKRLLHRASTVTFSQQQSKEEFNSADQAMGSEEPKDFWEGEQWEAFGKVAYLALPALVAMAAAVGIFASQKYNDGATVFLESAKSDQDTAALYTFDD